LLIIFNKNEINNKFKLDSLHQKHATMLISFYDSGVVHSNYYPKSQKLSYYLDRIWFWWLWRAYCQVSP